MIETQSSMLATLSMAGRPSEQAAPDVIGKDI